MDLSAYLTMLGTWVITTGLKVILIFILLLIGLKTAGIISEKIFLIFSRQKNIGQDAELQKRAKTISATIRSALKITMFVIAAIMILDALGIQVGPIIAAA